MLICLSLLMVLSTADEIDCSWLKDWRSIVDNQPVAFYRSENENQGESIHFLGSSGQDLGVLHGPGFCLNVINSRNGNTLFICEQEDSVPMMKMFAVDVEGKAIAISLRCQGLGLRASWIDERTVGIYSPLTKREFGPPLEIDNPSDAKFSFVSCAQPTQALASLSDQKSRAYVGFKNSLNPYNPFPDPPYPGAILMNSTFEKTGSFLTRLRVLDLALSNDKQYLAVSGSGSSPELVILKVKDFAPTLNKLSHELSGNLKWNPSNHKLAGFTGNPDHTPSMFIFDQDSGRYSTIDVHGRTVKDYCWIGSSKLLVATWDIGSPSKRFQGDLLWQYNILDGQWKKLNGLHSGLSIEFIQKG